jgi:putative ABC transport system substrate-binding protein
VHPRSHRPGPSKPVLPALLAVVLLAAAVPARAAEVVALIDPRVGPYVEALAGFRQGSQAEVRAFERREDDDVADEEHLMGAIRARHPDQVLAIGPEALRAALRGITDIPILFCMVLNPQARVPAGRTDVTGVAMNVAPEDQMRVLVKLLPRAKRVGALYNPAESGETVEYARRWLRRKNLVLEAEAARPMPALVNQVRNVLDRTDVYWMVPDDTLKNPDVLRLLFFQAVRIGKPLIGVSDYYVKAGALFALTADPEAMGRQAAELSNRELEGEAPAEVGIQPPRKPYLSLSRKTAATLGIRIPADLLKEARTVY